MASVMKRVLTESTGYGFTGVAVAQDGTAVALGHGDYDTLPAYMRRSSTRGRTWSEKADFPGLDVSDSFYSRLHFFLGFQALLVGSSYGRHVSYDNGQTWNADQSSYPFYDNADVYQPAAYAFVTLHDMLYQGGLTWVGSIGTPGAYGIAQAALDYYANNRAYTWRATNPSGRWDVDIIEPGENPDPILWAERWNGSIDRRITPPWTITFQQLVNLIVGWPTLLWLTSQRLPISIVGTGGYDIPWTLEASVPNADGLFLSVWSGVPVSSAPGALVMTFSEDSIAGFSGQVTQYVGSSAFVRFLTAVGTGTSLPISIGTLSEPGNAIEYITYSNVYPDLSLIPRAPGYFGSTDLGLDMVVQNARGIARRQDDTPIHPTVDPYYVIPTSTEISAIAVEIATDQPGDLNPLALSIIDPPPDANWYDPEPPYPVWTYVTAGLALDDGGPGVILWGIKKGVYQNPDSYQTRPAVLRQTRPDLATGQRYAVVYLPPPAPETESYYYSSSGGRYPYISDFVDLGDGHVLACGNAWITSDGMTFDPQQPQLWESLDYGATWTNVSTRIADIDNANGTVDYAGSTLLRLKNGHLVLGLVVGVHWPGTTTQSPFRISTDNGQTFTTLKRDPQEAYRTVTVRQFAETPSTIIAVTSGDPNPGEIWILKRGCTVLLRVNPDQTIKRYPWALTEFWRSDTPNVTTATILDRRKGLTLEDDPPDCTGTWYYWARLVTPSGKPGPWSDMVTVEL